MYEFPFVTKPLYLWVADAPPRLGGTPQQLPIAQIEQQHGFTYFEGLCVQEFYLPVINTFFGDRRFPEPIQDYFKNYEDNILKLVICKINEIVGYGVFAKDFIPADTIVGVYSGELKVDAFIGFAERSPLSTVYMCESQIRSEDNVGNDLAFIDGKNFGNICRFFQHLPAPLSSSTLITAQGEVATANIKLIPFFFGNVKCFAHVTARNVLAGEQLGLPYPIGYWNELKITCQYFDVNGAVLGST